MADRERDVESFGSREEGGSSPSVSDGDPRGILKRVESSSTEPESSHDNRWLDYLGDYLGDEIRFGPAYVDDSELGSVEEESFRQHSDDENSAIKGNQNLVRLPSEKNRIAAHLRMQRPPSSSSASIEGNSSLDEISASNQSKHWRRPKLYQRKPRMQSTQQLFHDTIQGLVETRLEPPREWCVRGSPERSMVEESPSLKRYDTSSDVDSEASGRRIQQIRRKAHQKEAGYPPLPEPTDSEHSAAAPASAPAMGVIKDGKPIETDSDTPAISLPIRKGKHKPRERETSGK